MRKLVLLAALLTCLAVPALAQDCSTLTYQTESIPEATLGEPYNFQIEAVGGVGPYHYTIYSGELPPGLHLTGGGKVVGMPREIADTTVFITLTDAQGCTLTQAFATRTHEPF